MNRNTLILFTYNYPYGNGETFLEQEIKYLSSSFKKVIIVSADKHSDVVRKVPKNVILIRKNIQINSKNKFNLLINSFNPIIIKETLSLIRNKSISILNLKYLLSSNFRGLKISSYISCLLSEYKLTNDQVLLYSYWWMDESIGLSYYKKHNPKVIAITRCHGFDIYKERTINNYLPLKSFTLNNLDGIFPISENAKNYIKLNYVGSSFSKKKICVSRLGVNNGVLNLYNRHPINEYVTIVSCGYIYPNKRIELILNAIQKLKFKTKWIHIGSYIKDFSEHYYYNLKDQINNNSNKNIEIILLENLSNSEVLDFYKNHPIDLFVNVSKSEGISVSIMEAMSFSIPVYATNVGGTSEIVNSNNGLLLNENINATDLCGKFEEFFSLKENIIKAKRLNAHKTSINKYNSSKNYRKFINHLNNLKL